MTEHRPPAGSPPTVGDKLDRAQDAVADWIDAAFELHDEPGRDPFDRVLEEIRELNTRKRADYADELDPWQNFRDSAYQTNITPGQAVEVMIATKQSRLRQLDAKGGNARNESRRDSRLDRAVYAVIAVAMDDAGLYEEELS